MQDGGPAEYTVPRVFDPKAEPRIGPRSNSDLHWIATKSAHPDVNPVFTRLQGESYMLASAQLGDERAVHADGQTRQDPKAVTDSARHNEPTVAGAAERGLVHHVRSYPVGPRRSLRWSTARTDEVSVSVGDLPVSQGVDRLYFMGIRGSRRSSSYERLIHASVLSLDHKQVVVA